jgi:hypothetical protein
MVSVSVLAFGSPLDMTMDQEVETRPTKPQQPAAGQSVLRFPDGLIASLCFLNLVSGLEQNSESCDCGQGTAQLFLQRFD